MCVERTHMAPAREVLQLIVGYSGLCLKNQQGSVAVKLITQARP